MVRRPTRSTKAKKASSRKKPSARKRKKKSSSRFWPFLGLIGLFLALGLIFLYLYPRPERFQYQLNQKIDLLDKAIHSRLFELGFSKGNILSRRSVSRMSGNLSWKTSSIELRLPERTSFSRIKNEMKRELTPVDRNVRLRFIEDPSQPKEIEVLLGNRLTHNLIFRRPKIKVPEKKVGPRVAIIIDDMGASKRKAREIMNFDAPITFSFLPSSRNSRKLAQEALKKGKEVILHMPMEPYGFPEINPGKDGLSEINPGKGGLLMSMTEEELHRQIRENIDKIPHISGINNHMGSRFMEDERRVNILMRELKARKLFFLDSRTTPKTVGYRAARKLGIKTGQRDVFLDNNSNDEAEIRRNISELAEIAKNEGKAIGIAHPHPSTIRGEGNRNRPPFGPHGVTTP
jgi:polysaccharide deacetylase 2 family uncharacterized protein YibQ